MTSGGAMEVPNRQKGGRDMISAGISNATRKAVYKREGYRCAVCDSTKYFRSTTA